MPGEICADCSGWPCSHTSCGRCVKAVPTRSSYLEHWMCGWVKHLKQGQPCVISCPKQPSDRSSGLGAEAGLCPVAVCTTEGHTRTVRKSLWLNRIAVIMEKGGLKGGEAPLVQLSRVLGAPTSPSLSSFSQTPPSWAVHEDQGEHL